MKPCGDLNGHQCEPRLVLRPYMLVIKWTTPSLQFRTVSDERARPGSEASVDLDL